MHEDTTTTQARQQTNPPRGPALRCRPSRGRAVAPRVMRGLMPPAPPSRGLPRPRNPRVLPPLCACRSSGGFGGGGARASRCAPLYPPKVPLRGSYSGGGPHFPPTWGSAMNCGGAPIPRRRFFICFSAPVFGPWGPWRNPRRRRPVASSTSLPRARRAGPPSSPFASLRPRRGRRGQGRAVSRPWGRGFFVGWRVGALLRAGRDAPPWASPPLRPRPSSSSAPAF